MLKRSSLVILIVIGVLTSTTAAADAKPEGRWRGPCSTWIFGENLTPASWAANPDRGRRQMRRLIVCVFDRWAPGNSQRALYVADRESSLYPYAWNVTGDSRGLFQHLGAYWPGRVRAFLARWMFAPYVWPPTAFDPRASAIVAARMVAAGGWAPWGG